MLNNIDYAIEDVVRRRSSRAKSMSQSESSNRSSKCKCHCRFWKRPSQVMKLVPHVHTRTTQKKAEFPQPQFINKVGDDRVTTQRQIPQSKWRCDETVGKSQIRVRAKVVDSSCPTENRQRRTDAARAVLQSEAMSKSSPESSEKYRASTVTACTRNDVIRNQTHEDGKDLRRARYSQLGCCQDCQRSSQRSRRQWRWRREPNTTEGKETSRAKSIWHEESNQIATVLNSIHQFKIQAHRLNRSRSGQEINKHVSDGISKDREN